MWRLKQFLPKDHSSLQGKTVEIGSLKLQIRSIIAQGGFSSVYSAKDSQTGKHYALKHIICNDVEPLDLAKKEIAVMKSLRGHPNVVMLHANVILDTGRAKECFIAMDQCEKTLVNVLDGRETSYFDEKHLLITFRDICNAVYALHCQSPVISHRDLKAENILLGPDGAWKLCDFGSTSTNHKRFDKPEEMGIEEDVIRKHTTPAYRAPEMWDLYSRELICEKVDIWALGCLLYRMAYMKLAFDGDSKLQILNGNYHIPDSPNYSPDMTNLIKDMLKSIPEARPDIMQIWHRVNNLLPSDERKSAPDKPPSLVKSEVNAGPLGCHSIMSKRKTDLNSAENYSPRNGDSGRWAGSFWSSSVAQETQLEGSYLSDSQNIKNSTSIRSSSQRTETRSLKSEQICHDVRKNGASLVAKGSHTARTWGEIDNELHDPVLYESESSELPKPAFSGKHVATESLNSSWSKTSPEYVDLSPITAASSNPKTSEHVLDQIEGLKTALEEALQEKTEMLAKFKKLSTLCRSQRQEIQDLKSSLVAISNRNIISTAKDPLEAPSISPTHSMRHVNAQQKQLQAERWQVFDEDSDKQKRPITDLKGSSPSLLPKSPASIALTWQASDNSESRLSTGHMARFPDHSVVGTGNLQGNTAARSIEGRHARHHVRSASVGGEDWEFGRSRFMANSKVAQDSTKLENSVYLDGTLRAANTSRNGTAAVQRFSSKSQQPAGWAAF